MVISRVVLIGGGEFRMKTICLPRAEEYFTFNGARYRVIHVEHPAKLAGGDDPLSVGDPVITATELKFTATF